MTPAIQEVRKPICEADLKMLTHQTGPCVTISVPPFRPGDGAGSRHAVLRELAHTAAARLRDLHRQRGAESMVQDIVDAIERLVALADDHHGGPAMTLFASPGFEVIYVTPGVRAGNVTVGSRFEIIPLFAQAAAPHEFYVLGLTTKRVRLWRYSYGHCEELSLPLGVPVSLEAAGAFDVPDHDLENRSTAGPMAASGVAGTKRVRFGTSSDREAHGEYLRHFLSRIDQGLKDVIRNNPLFLAGVREEVTEYRKVAKHPYIFSEQCLGSPEHASLDQVAAHASAGALREFYSAAKRAAESLSEEPNKIAGDASRTLKAAQEGRVRRLFVAEHAKVPSHPVLDGGFDGEDLINACVVETLKTGGAVYVLEGCELPGGEVIGAILRY